MNTAETQMNLIHAIMEIGRAGCSIDSHAQDSLSLNVPDGAEVSTEAFATLKQYKSLLYALSHQGALNTENVCVGDHEKTYGDYQAESDACDVFDECAHSSGMWIVHREIVGTPWQPRPFANQKQNLRIDRILQPKQRLLDLGWPHGCVGVEIKASGVKIGPPVSQMLDYSRCVWQLPTGNATALKYIFLFPCRSALGNMMSVMHQNNLGFAMECGRRRLGLKLGGTGLFSDRGDKGVDIRSDVSGGAKAGSR
jgi:hypothetical protein